MPAFATKKSRYATSSRDYLKRANECLRETETKYLFYAALELRFGIEARMREYLDAWQDVAQKKKQGWRIGELGRNLEKTFRLGNAVVRWAVSYEPANELGLCLYHTPVTKDLRSTGERLGNYLHSKRHRNNSDVLWLDALKDELVSTSDKLRIANIGTLLGPPLHKSGTNEFKMHFEVPPGYTADGILKKLMGKTLKIDVQYLESLPDVIETAAVVWKDFD